MASIMFYVLGVWTCNYHELNDRFKTNTEKPFLGRVYTINAQ